MAFTTWSTTRLANMTLSGGNLTATASSSAAGVIAADTQTSGKFYWEITTGATFSTSGAIGLSNGSANVGAIAPTGANGVVWGGSGATNVNGTSTGTIASYSTNTLLCIAVDLTAKLIWFRVGAAGNWNNNVANNPATGVGGINITGAISTYANAYPWFGSNTGTLLCTANFGASAFTGTVPSGFTSGWTTGTTAVTSLATTQVGAEAWVTESVAPFRATQVGAEAWVTQAHGTVNITQTGLNTWVTNTKAPVRITQVGQTVWIDLASPVISPIGRLATASIGIPTPQIATAAVNVSLTGVEADTALGSPSVASDASIALTGVQATAAVGSLAFEADANISLTGVASTGLLGTLVSEIDTAISTGVQINTAIGTPTLEISFLIGQQANTGLGIPTASLEVDIIVTGVGAKASVGNPLTNIRTGSQIVMSGRQANAAIGHPLITVSALLPGASTSAFIGAPSVISYNGSMQFNDLMVEEGLTIPPDSMVSLRWSDTDGQSWNDPVHRSLGETGDYLRNLQWQRMGMARRGRVYELSWSSPIPTCLLGTTLRFNTGRS